MKTILLIVLGAVAALAAVQFLGRRPAPAPAPAKAPDRFYATLAGPLIAAGAPRSVFGPGEVAAIYIQGPGYEGRELRVRILRGSEVLFSSGPVMIGGGHYHAWSLPQVGPGDYAAELLLDGASTAKLELQVRP